MQDCYVLYNYTQKYYQIIEITCNTFFSGKLMQRKCLPVFALTILLASILCTKGHNQEHWHLSDVTFNEEFSGDGTYYYINEMGNCMIEADSSFLYAAMNNAQYDNAGVCGSCVEITGPAGTVIVKIVDRCPECTFGDIDMSPAAFAKLDNPEKGRIPIRWRFVNCATSGPIEYRFKDQSSQWWTGVQILNHRTPVERFEFKSSSHDEFTKVERTMYNYFVYKDGFGNGPYIFRIYDIFGTIITDSGIFIQEQKIQSKKQF